MDREQMVTELKRGVCTVTFTKVNGDERVMTCTLDESLLPLDESKESERTHYDTVIPVYEIGLDAWRSFRVDSVKSFCNTIGEELVNE